jgi:hypothetical protein
LLFCVFFFRCERRRATRERGWRPRAEKSPQPPLLLLLLSPLSKIRDNRPVRLSKWYRMSRSSTCAKHWYATRLDTAWETGVKVGCCSSLARCWSMLQAPKHKTAWTAGAAARDAGKEARGVAAVAAAAAAAAASTDSASTARLRKSGQERPAALETTMQQKAAATRHHICRSERASEAR